MLLSCGMTGACRTALYASNHQKTVACNNIQSLLFIHQRLERRRCVLNAAPRAAYLFVRAIVMSGACVVGADAGWGPGNHSYGLHAGAAFAHGASLQARTNAFHCERPVAL